jgi:hypothetical protein
MFGSEIYRAATTVSQPAAKVKFRGKRETAYCRPIRQGTHLSARRGALQKRLLDGFGDRAYIGTRSVDKDTSLLT